MKEKSIEFCNKPQHVLRSCGKLLLRLLTAVLEFHHYYTLLFLPLQFGFLFSILGKYKTFKGHWILTCFGLSRPKREGNKRAGAFLPAKQSQYQFDRDFVFVFYCWIQFLFLFLFFSRVTGELSTGGLLCSIFFDYSNKFSFVLFGVWISPRNKWSTVDWHDILSYDILFS